jgi:hypothetical protein
MTIRRADDNSYTLAASASATGAAVAVKGGEYLFCVDGTPGGATAQLQILMPNGTWSPVAVFSNSLVSTTTLPFAQTGVDLPACNVRVALNGGTPSGVNAYLVGLG